MSLATPLPTQTSGATSTPDPSVDWFTRGSCVGMDPDALFVQGKEQRAAKVVCRGCPVALECLADALDSQTEFGVWGGMTERERRALLRRHPDVTSWRDVLTKQAGRPLV